MNGLSLFNGMGCAEIALIEAGIKYDLMYTSEIDKFALQQTRLNFPKNIELGDVQNIDVSKLEKIDILMGGSPCQSFSFAGKRKGMTTKCEIQITRLEQYLELKEQGFEFEGQSYLFWEYMRILTDIRKYNPDVKFLLENVEMGKKWERVLSEAIGIFPVHINSSLVSAQNRKRVYWTNIRTKKIGFFNELYSDIPQPKDRKILLKDILESEVDEKYYIKSDSMFKFVTDGWRQNKLYTQINGKKALPQMARQYQSWCGDYVEDNVCVAMRGRGEGWKQEIEPNYTGKTNALTSVQKDNMLMLTKWERKNYTEIDVKAKSLMACCYKGNGTNGMSLFNDPKFKNRIRRLTPIECARLQGVPNWYKWNVSDTQQYKMLGNGWQIDTIIHIFSFL